MTTKVDKSIMVNVPVSVAYNQWTQFEDFPQFMGGVKSVTQLSDDRLEWVAEIAGVKRQWQAKILEQVPDRKVAWAATEGATNAGSVTFEDLGGGQTSVKLFLEYEPEGLVEKVGDKLNVVERQAEGDLERFKAFIEAEGYATGAWRGSVNADANVGTPGVGHAQSSVGDSGKAGVSAKAVAAGIGVAAAAAGVAAAVSGKSDSSEEATTVETSPAPVPVVADVESDADLRPGGYAADAPTPDAGLGAPLVAGTAAPIGGTTGTGVMDDGVLSDSGADIGPGSGSDSGPGSGADFGADSGADSGSDRADDGLDYPADDEARVSLDEDLRVGTTGSNFDGSDVDPVDPERNRT